MPNQKKTQLTPNKHHGIIYGSNQQLIPKDNTGPDLDAASVNRMQEIIWALLYYARAVGNHILVDISAIVSQQSAATEPTDYSTIHS